MIADTAGWTTDAANYIRIYTPYLSAEVGVSQRHSGVWDASKYQMIITSANVGHNGSIMITVPDFRLEGLQIWADPSSITEDTLNPDFEITNSSEPLDVRINDNIIKGRTNPGTLGWLQGPTDAYTSNYNGYVRVWNNLIYGFSGDSTEALQGDEGSWEIYNNTVYGGEYGLDTIGAILKNNLVMGSSIITPEVITLFGLTMHIQRVPILVRAA